jgi:alpha-L-rhamnosidase
MANGFFCRITTALVLVALSTPSTLLSQGSTMKASHLTCEFMEDPLGIDQRLPRLGWIVESPVRGDFQTAHRILVASTPEKLAAEQGDLWDSGKIPGDRATMITFDGRPLTSHLQCFWKVMLWDKNGKPGDWSEAAFWSMGLLNPAEWKATWIGYDAPHAATKSDSSWKLPKDKNVFLPPPRYLKTNFSVSRPVRRAVAYVSALGICDLYLDNTRVSDDRFTPGWTDYSRRVYYRTYDLSQRLVKGNHAIGAILADGWYSGYLGYAADREVYGARPRLLVQLRLEYADGTVEEVGSGRTWKATTGPLGEADFLMGESFDARRAGQGLFGTDDGGAHWESVDEGAEVHPLLRAHPAPPVRSFAELTPKTITAVAPGTWVFDLGQNFAGVVRLRVSGKSGQKVTLRYAERLNPDGTVYTTNLRAARALDTYICSGVAEEVWEPRFTFHGFQYVEIKGLSQPPTPSTITGIALSSATPPAGSFECSDPMVNQLASNILWTQRANFIDIPTDCPQRDERLGWTGDAQVYVHTACLNADVQAFFHKWLVDLTDAQRADGQFPMVAPTKVATDDGGPAWADAGVICPWTIYEMYGDRSILESCYAAMTRFVEFTRKRSTVDLLPPEKFHCFGDWLNINAETPKEVIYTAYFARSTFLTAKAAAVLGKKNDASTYEQLFANVKSAFNSAYVDSEGRVKGNSQTGYVLALAFGLLDEPVRSRAAEHLIADIESRGWHLSTGFVGTKELMLVLSSLGRHDVAYRLLHNETFPSWGFTVKNGATSIWERWDGWTPEKGFQDPGMNSFAHYSFGAVYQWMVEHIGGIKSDGPGYRKILIEPQPGGKLTSARVSYRSVSGPITTAWKIEGGQMSLTVNIPANTSARILLPGVAGPVLESGKPAADQPGLKAAEKGTYEAASGNYVFVYPYTPGGSQR